jgi:hypothetical protein
MVLKIERFQPEGMNVRMSGGKPSYSHVVTVSDSGKIGYTAGQSGKPGARQRASGYAASRSSRRRRNELCAELHNRMPAVLKPDAWPAWLGELPADVPELKALLAP